MASPLFTFRQYLHYRANARNAHHLHSPFLFHLYRELLHRSDSEEEKKLLKLRRKLLQSDQLIAYTDPKTGIRHQTNAGRLSRKVASGHRFSRFLKRLIDERGYQRVMETGTSTGINTLYMARSNAREVVTLEGSAELSELAARRFRELQISHVHTITGAVQDTFSRALQAHQPELVFLDADHRSATIRFYLDHIRQCPSVDCIVIHDIHWSEDMHACWNQIIARPEYTLTIDLFQAGLIFPRYPMQKQHFVIRF